MDDFEELVRKNGAALTVGPYQFVGWKATAIVLGFAAALAAVTGLVTTLIINLLIW